MEIKGIGIDIVSISRIETMISTYGDKFLKRVFTEKEIEYGQHFITSSEVFAGKFAAKEAVMKTIRKTLPFNSIEILNYEDGKPYATGYPGISISISHEREFAVAMAIEVGE